MTQAAALYIRVSITLQAVAVVTGLKRREVEARAYATRLGRTPDRGRAD